MKRYIHNHSRRGFSLLEFIAVLIIVSALSVALIPRLPLGPSNVLSAKNDVMRALQTARQIALARSHATTPPAAAIRFIASANTISVMEGTRVIQLSETSYPLIFPAGITMTQGVGTLLFDHLGNTSPREFEISDGNTSARITINQLGFIQQP